MFLAHPSGHYMGRLCAWKQCVPGIRTSCDALHCGRRPFLHDDLATIRLAPAMVAHPPLDLFPEVRRRVPIPADVEAILVQAVPTLAQETEEGVPTVMQASYPGSGQGATGAGDCGERIVAALLLVRESVRAAEKRKASEPAEQADGPGERYPSRAWYSHYT